MPTEFFALLIVATVVSFLGFGVENIRLSLTKGYMDNRSVHLPHGTASLIPSFCTW
ncbi:MAG: hypothetical protein ACI3XI_01070 [Eubacteriales bacterium]